MVLRWQVSYVKSLWQVGTDQPIQPVAKWQPKAVGTSGIEYFSYHYKADGTGDPADGGLPEKTVTVQFASPPDQAGDLAFSISGTAVNGTHFQLLTASPRPFVAGQGSVDITIRLLDPGVWFREKLISINLTGGTNVTLGSQTEYRIYTRPTVDPPQISWDTSGQTAGVGAQTIQANLSTASGEDTNIYYTFTTDIDVADFTLDASGSAVIPAGSTNADVDLTIGAGASSGETLVLSLEHEASDGSDRNDWTNTHDWSLEVGVGEDDPERAFAGDPSNFISGGGDFIDGAPQNVVDDKRFIEIIAPSTVQTSPDGDVIQGIVQTEWISDDGYIRESLEGTTYAGLDSGLLALREFTFIAFRIETFNPPDENRNWRFCRIAMRSRVLDMEHSIVFDRESTGLNSAGEASSFSTTTSTGVWGEWLEKNLGPNDTYGVTEVTVDGQPTTVVWFRHEYVNGTQYTNNKGNQVEETLGVDTFNGLLRFTYFSASDGSAGLTGGASSARGSGLMPYWPQYQRASVDWGSVPLKFWERRSHFWEPRGAATLNAGGNLVHTFTVA